MGFATSAKTLAVGAAWRLTGNSAAGRALVDTVATGDESDRTLAGMLLVRAGERSIEPIGGAFDRGAGSLELIDVLASIGGSTARQILEGLADGGEGELGQAAVAALSYLDQAEGHEN